MSATKMVFKIFYIFDLEKEENWLKEMASKGWFLQKINLGVFYTFAKGEPKDTVYRIDFNNKIKDIEEYYDLFVQSGWSFIDKWSVFRYFKYSGQISSSSNKIDIYNDPSQQLNWLHKRLLIFLSAYGFEFVDLYTLLFLKGNKSMGVTLGSITILLCILLLTIILTKFISSYAVLKRKLKEKEDVDYYSKGTLKRFSSTISLFIVPIVITVALFSGITVLSTVGSSEKAIKNKVLKWDSIGLYPMKTVDYVISEDLKDFKVSLYGNERRIGIVALEKLIFDRYKVVTNFSSNLPKDRNAIIEPLKLGQDSYLCIYGKDDKQEIDKVVIKYKVGTDERVADDKIIRKDGIFIMLIKTDRSIENIKIFDKDNKDISHKYIDIKNKTF